MSFPWKQADHGALTATEARHLGASPRSRERSLTLDSGVILAWGTGGLVEVAAIRHGRRDRRCTPPRSWSSRPMSASSRAFAARWSSASSSESARTFLNRLIAMAEPEFGGRARRRRRQRVDRVGEDLELGDRGGGDVGRRASARPCLRASSACWGLQRAPRNPVLDHSAMASSSRSSAAPSLTSSSACSRVSSSVSWLIGRSTA